MSVSTDWRELLAQQAPGMDERQLAAFIAYHRLDGEDSLSDAVDIDARARSAASLQPKLTRYLAAVPSLLDQRTVLDAAIDATLRGMRRGGIDAESAATTLKLLHPDLASQIEVAAVLDQVVVGSSTIEGAIRPQQSVDLPISVGELLDGGQRRYMLMRPLGRGSQATVYLAIDQALSSPDQPAWVAVKVFGRSSRTAATPTSLHEAQAVRRINHPGIVRVQDRGQSEDGLEYVVVEYVEGTALHLHVDPRGHAIQPREAARMVADLASALQAAHNAGVLHRDLKPANVLVTKEGVPKISDFGLADRIKLHGPALDVVGSYAFMSPEQYRRDRRAFLASSDIYSLGGILFWMLTAQPPNGESTQDVETRLWQGENASPLDPRVHRPSLDPDLAAICRKALAPNPLDRYASAEGLASDLRLFLAHRPIEWNSPSWTRRVRLWCRNSPRTAALSAAAIFLLMAGSASIATAWGLDAVRSLQSRLAIETERSTRVQAEQDAAVSRAKLDAVRDVMSAALVSLGDPTGPPNEGWLQSTITAEAMLGPTVLGRSDGGLPLWKMRLETIRRLIERARTEGREHHMEVALWRSLLGLWLVRTGEYDAALMALNQSLDRWQTMLADDDAFLRDLRALRAAAELGLAARPGAAPESVARARDALLDYLDDPIPENVRHVLQSVLDRTAEPAP